MEAIKELGKKKIKIKNKLAAVWQTQDLPQA